MAWGNKRVIVTGGAGVIGNELVERLATKGAKIRCFDIVPKPQMLPQEVDYYKRDLSELAPNEFIAFEPEIMFHLAATFERTVESLEFWETNFKNNVLLSHQVINAAKSCRHLERFIFASSYLVYSPNLYLFPHPQSNPTKLKEDSLISPRNLCGAAKYYTEKEIEYLSNFEKYAFTSISARIFRVYGHGSRDVISRWVKAGLKGEKIEVFGRGNSFDYIFAGDVAEGLIKLAESKESHGAVNLGTGIARKIDEVVEIIQRALPQIRIDEIEGADMQFEASSADTSLLNRLTEWQPQIRLEEGIKSLIDFGLK